jgi:hypothetical protein
MIQYSRRTSVRTIVEATRVYPASIEILVKITEMTVRYRAACHRTMQSLEPVRKKPGVSPDRPSHRRKVLPNDTCLAGFSRMRFYSG